MSPNPQFSADLVTFTEKILNGKRHFLCSVNIKPSTKEWNSLSYYSRLLIKQFEKLKILIKHLYMRIKNRDRQFFLAVYTTSHVMNSIVKMDTLELIRVLI